MGDQHFLDTLRVASEVRAHKRGKKAGPEGLRLLAVAGTLPPHDLEDALGCLKALEGVRATGATNMMHRKNVLACLEQLDEMEEDGPWYHAKENLETLHKSLWLQVLKCL
jgi:hypothetical protein